MRRSLGALVAATGVVLCSTSGGRAQESIHFLPDDRVSVRVMADVPAIDLAPGVRVRTVVGTTGSFSYADFEPGSAAPLHHHEREQADVGLTGTFDMTIGTQVEKLAPRGAVIVPSNVAHSIANTGTTSAALIEFHTIRRPDLVPPRPAVTFPASAQPVAVSDGRLFVRPPAPNQAGETCTLTWTFVRPGQPVERRPALGVERFVYVVSGEVIIAKDGKSERVGAGSLILEPAGRQAGIAPRDNTEGVLVEFTPGRLGR